MPERCVAALCNNVNGPENKSIFIVGSWTYVTGISLVAIEHVILVVSSRGRPQENRILNFVKILKKIAFYPNRKIFSQKLIRWNVELDERKIFFFDIMGTLRWLKTVIFLWGAWALAHFSARHHAIIRGYTVCCYATGQYNLKFWLKHNGRHSGELP